jgi:putative ATPase
MVIAGSTRRRFRELSAVTAGVKDVRLVVEEAKRALGETGAQTVLFVDEVHRFSKTQQDALLPSVENRWVTLVAATTENPFFSVISPLLSRSLLLSLEPLTDDEIRVVVDRALVSPRGLDGQVRVDDEALDHLVRLSGGDARRALTALEAAAGAVSPTQEGPGVVTLQLLEQAVDKAAVRYDRDGDQHYDVISGFIKSIRGSDVDASLHYLARMFEAGEDPRFIARRLVVLASEDVGMADPSSLTVAVAAAQALELIGMPEARLNLAQAVIHLALAPKSNAVLAGIESALVDIRSGRTGTVPPHLRDSHYPGAKKVGVSGYRYPHDFPGRVVAQQYAPDPVVGREYYSPGGLGVERVASQRLAGLREVLRGARGVVPEDAADGFRPRCKPVPPTAEELQALAQKERP